MVSGKCIIVSAPSGAGKTTIVHSLLKKIESLSFSISACSRDKRGTENDGVDYHFLGIDEFKKKISDEAFIEWEEVYPNQFYGTLKSEIKSKWANNKVVIFDVDVIGGLNLKKYFGENSISIFIMPPDFETLEKRLRFRATESEEKILMRLSKANKELVEASKFDYVIVNKNLDKAITEAESIVSNFINS